MNEAEEKSIVEGLASTPRTAAAEIRRLRAMVFNPKNYPWQPYDPEANDTDRIAWLEHRVENLTFEDIFHERFIEAAAEATHEIASSMPSPVTRENRPATLATYWRWGLWMDCMADVPEQVQLCLQGLVGAAFDSGRS